MGNRSTASASRGRAARTPAGRASAAGTTRYCGRWSQLFAEDYFRQTHTGLTVSALGLGTYLGDSDDATDELYAETTRAALAGGMNVIDTAINYRCQRSERVVGRVLRDSITAGVVQRDEIVVCTKGGFLPLEGAPPATREEYARYVQSEYIDTGILRQEEIVAGGHSVAPAFLENQVGRSRANLGVATIDRFYVHNPDQQLASVTPETLAGRMREAFTMLESCVDANAIGTYGCSTWNGLRLPHGSQGHLSLYVLESLAREVAGDAHHFRAVQLPVNLSMSEAVRVSTQRDARGRLKTVVEAAEELGIDVVVSAPLMQGQLASNLPASVQKLFAGGSDAQRALAFTRSLPGVTTVAVGARRLEHLEENLALFRAPA